MQTGLRKNASIKCYVVTLLRPRKMYAYASRASSMHQFNSRVNWWVYWDLARSHQQVAAVTRQILLQKRQSQVGTVLEQSLPDKL